MDKILAVVLAFNTGPKILDVCGALRKHDVRILIIDNGSDAPISNWIEDIPVLTLQKGVGIIHGRNLGLLQREPDEGVLCVADDAIVPDGPWEEIMMNHPNTTLALRPEKDPAFRGSYKISEDGQYFEGAPTSFQAVYFPPKVLGRIGYIDERYIWGDDGLMMRKNPHGAIKDYFITLLQIHRGPRYQPMRTFYEELWRPGKVDGAHWEKLPVRYTIDEFRTLAKEKCDTIWSMDRKSNPEYYDISKKILGAFEKIWADPTWDRMEFFNG